MKPSIPASEPASSSASLPSRAVFFDRDGVVNHSPGDGYVLSWDGFEFMRGIFELVSLAHDRGYLPILATSQRCVGKGLISQDALADIHQRMQSTLAIEAVPFHDLMVFTGQPHDADWEKPKPGMLLAAAERHHIDLSASILIGDADRDIEMAQAAGIPTTIRLVGDKPITTPATHTVQTLAEAKPLFDRILS